VLKIVRDLLAAIAEKASQEGEERTKMCPSLPLCVDELYTLCGSAHRPVTTVPRQNGGAPAL